MSIRLTEEQIWVAQQGNCYWEDKEKGRVVADAQLAHLAQCAPKEALLTDEEIQLTDNGFPAGGCPAELHLEAGREVAQAQLTKVWPITEARIEQARVEERKKILRELEEMDLIKGHHGHKKGEVALVSCPRCTFEALQQGKQIGE